MNKEQSSQQKPKVGQFTCDNCGRSFDSQDELHEHAVNCSRRKPEQDPFLVV